MKNLKCLILLCLGSLSLNAQNIKLEHHCSIDISLQPKVIYPVEPSENAQKIIDTLLNYVPVERRTISFMSAATAATGVLRWPEALGRMA